ncbi:hypothetical protein UFOVP787_151 [uncultured Caudovirales phage]|uniref:Uncharacterized protein n=1 Tax=uncultured Caudovirales phage TaxID=2100421 RepID=A0A6J5NSW9_9CAUD|nr:hypothetical protein UFOVP787_151 [uncultured Caudovirales phage]
MTDNKYDISDLVVAALEQKPLDFENAFNDLIVDRIASRINDEKINIARQMYNYNEEEESNSEEEFNSEEEQDGEDA